MVDTYQFIARGICLFLAVLSGWVFASPVPPDIATQAAAGWLARHSSPMESHLPAAIYATDAIAGLDNKTLYYVVNLEPQGFVVLSADDAIEPVIAFSTTGSFDYSKDSPLRTLLDGDMKGRLEYVRQRSSGDLQAKQRAGQRSAPFDKWQSLLDAAEPLDGTDGGIQPLGLLSISDVRVLPLVQSKWDQGNAAGGYCYNYYTPNNYPTGCVATAMAQLMRFHEWPQAGIGVRSFQIRVDNVYRNRTTLGGNGAGGPYVWSQMPYDPQTGLTTAQRQAIGALCHDAGVSVKMSYTSSSSSASSLDASNALKNTFGYTGSVYSGNFSWGTMNANLDAGLPVLLSVSGPSGGHAILADGYGYLDEAMYHHLNMGWGGLDDAWYQLPEIDAYYYTFNTLSGCVYNVYPTGTGEIISGRVLSMAGAPLEAAVVTAYQGASIIAQTQTNERGIYALKNLPSNQSFILSAVKDGYAFVDRLVSTGFSQNHNAVSGNQWGIDFSATNPMPPTAIDQTVDVHSLSDICIQLVALDDNMPMPPGRMTFIVTSLPSHGTLSEPAVGVIERVPYRLAADANSVCYTPCPYFGGQDSFTFKANDGGTPPTGGDSNSATVTINVDNQLYTEYAPDSNTYSSFMMNTSEYYSMRSQVIYLQSDIGGAQYISELALRTLLVPGRTLNNWTIRMQHTNWTTFSNPATKFLTSGWTTVYQANETISQTGWSNFMFQKPFYYNGTQNLLVDFSYTNNGTSSPAGGCSINPNTGTSRVLSLASTSGTHGNPLNWDFWSLGGSYYSGYVPSVKLVGVVPIEPMPGDFNASCTVNLPDFAILAAAWKSQNGEGNFDPICDISTPQDDLIDLLDLLVFVEHWLEQYSH